MLAGLFMGAREMSLDHVKARYQEGVPCSRVGMGLKASNETLGSFEKYTGCEGSLQVHVTHRSEQHFGLL